MRRRTERSSIGSDGVEKIVRLRLTGGVEMTRWVRIRKKLRLLVQIIKKPSERLDERRLNIDDITYEDLIAGRFNLELAKEKGLINRSEDAVGFFFGGLYDYRMKRLQLHGSENLENSQTSRVVTGNSRNGGN